MKVSGPDFYACLLILFAMLGVLVARPVGACEVEQSKIVFPGMGTHVAWFCKATVAEKQQALEEIKRHACVASKLAGKTATAIELVDVVPYWNTKLDAQRAGPILNCRITLKASMENGVEKTSGISVQANGRKIVMMPSPQANPAPGSPPPEPVVLGVRFEVEEPWSFERECPATGCTERFATLCEGP